MQHQARKQPLGLILSFLALLFLAGCADNSSSGASAAAPATNPIAEKAEKLSYTGEIKGTSEKAKSISIEVGKGNEAKTMLVKYDAQTKGVQHAAKGQAVVIDYELRGDEPYALEIQRKLAKLPEGVPEIKTVELNNLLQAKQKVYLVDSRPEARYAQSHLPGAHSIPVPLLEQKKAQVLPKDQNELLIFYCGGPT